MAKAKVVYEYTDASGTVRQVDSIAEVPPKYRRNMLATGQDAKTSTETWTLPKFTPEALQRPQNPAVLIGLLVVAVLFMGRKNYLLMTVAGAIVGIWLFLKGTDWMMGSSYLKTYQPPPPPAQEDGPR